MRAWYCRLINAISNEQSIVLEFFFPPDMRTYTRSRYIQACIHHNVLYNFTANLSPSAK